MTTTCTAPDAATAADALTAIQSVRDNFDNLADQVAALIACLDRADDNADNLADRARLAEVPRSVSMRSASAIGDQAAAAAGHLRRAEAAIRNARSRTHQLLDIAQEAQQGRH